MRVGTPTVIQMEAAECGAAALGILLGYYDFYVSLEELRFRCGVSRDGVNAYNMIKAAKYYGLEADGYRANAEQALETKVPSILFWENNHFVVLEGFKKDRVYINDPATGPRFVYRDEFERCYSQIVLQMQPGPAFKRGGESPSLFAAIKKRVSEISGSLLYLFFIQFILVVIGLAMPVFTQVFIDKILKESILSWTGTYLALFAGVAAFIALMTWIQGYFLNVLRTRLSIKYSTDFLGHILQLPIAFFSQRYGAEVINRMKLNTAVANTLTGQVVVTYINLMIIGIYALIMIQYDVFITLIGIATAIVNLTVLYFVSRKRQNAYALFQQEQGKTVGVSLDALQNIETIKANCNDAYFFSRIAGYYARNINAMQNLGYKDSWLFSLSYFSQQFTTVLLLGFGCWRVIHGHLTIGMLIGLQLILNNFLKPFRELVEFGARMQTFGTDLNRLDDVLKNKIDPMIADKRDAHLQNKFQGNLELKNVSFGYNPLAPPLISNFDLKIASGKWVAIVGKVGVGKSTIAKLACSLYQPWNGQVLYDEKPRSEYARKVLMHSLASIDQDILLFSGTIRENLTLWDSAVPLDDVIQAAQDACIHEDILMCTEGYDFQLAEGGMNFSAGQRQRLEIARALVLNPALLIMDEATSALDSATESRIVENIRRRGCSCLIISHRLNAVKYCDEILVLENGKIIQRGTHERLKETPGRYQEFLVLEEKEV